MGTCCAVLQPGADGGFHTLRWRVSDCSWIVSSTYIRVWFNLRTLALCEKTAADRWVRKLNTPKRSKIREETRAASSEPWSCLGCFQKSPGKSLCPPCSLPGTAPLLNPPPRLLQGVQHLFPQQISRVWHCPAVPWGRMDPYPFGMFSRGHGAGKAPSGLRKWYKDALCLASGP